MKRVLLADDSVAARKSIQTMLETAGIEVVAVGNGELALSRFDDVAPHMVLLDAFLPGRSGYEVCAMIKENPVRAKTPVLLVTSEFEPFDERAASEAGADGHLRKPLDMAALATIRAVWNRADSASSGERVSGDLVEEPVPETAPAPPAAPSPDTFITLTMRAPEIDESGTDRSLSSLPDLTTDPGIRRDAVRAARLAASLGMGPAKRARVPGTVEFEDGEPLPPTGDARIQTVEISALRAIDRRCPACGTQTADGDIFCLSCGAMVLVTEEEAKSLAATSVCPGCREEVLEGEVICVACGTVL